MELKDISKLLRKINSVLNNDTIGYSATVLESIDSLSAAPSYIPSFGNKQLVKLDDGRIVLIPDYSLLESDSTGGIIAVGPDKGEYIVIHEKLTVSKRLLYSRVVDILGKEDSDTLIRFDMNDISKSLLKYIKVDCFRDKLSDSNKNEIEILINELNTLNKRRNLIQ